MVTVAGSGYGKDQPGACINSLASACGLERFTGPARFMSASGLRETLMQQPSVLCILDEFGGFLRQINGPNVGLYNTKRALVVGDEKPDGDGVALQRSSG